MTLFSRGILEMNSRIERTGGVRGSFRECTQGWDGNSHLRNEPDSLLTLLTLCVPVLLSRRSESVFPH